MNFILEVPRKEPVDPCRPRHPGGMQEYAWENLMCHPPVLVVNLFSKFLSKFKSMTTTRLCWWSSA